MARFTSTFVNKVDRKGRVSVPASFRRELLATQQESFFAYPSFKVDAIQCLTHERMQQLIDRLDQLDEFSDARDDMAHAVIASAQEIAFDRDGRIVLPADLAEFAGIADAAAFVGLGREFQMWAPERAKAQVEAVRARVRTARPTLAAAGAGSGSSDRTNGVES